MSSPTTFWRPSLPTVLEKPKIGVINLCQIELNFKTGRHAVRIASLCADCSLFGLYEVSDKMRRTR